MSKPLRPASSSVGTSGSADERLAVVTASARSLPALMCGSTGVMVSNDIVIWPPSRSVVSGPLPLYGMCSSSVPVMFSNCVPIRCCAVPLPLEP